MIIDEIYKDKFLDLIWAMQDQNDMIKRIIIEVDPDFKKSIIDSLIQKDEWPCAIHPSLIIETEEKKAKRAQDIINRFINRRDDNLTGKNFLDFGCGEGHVVRQAQQTANIAMGYDICQKGWNEEQFLTDNFNTIKKHAPYDTILIFDVLDHLIDDEPIDILKKLTKLLSDSGRMFIRFHPWCSKHSNHVYKNINKAYIHYFYNDEELKQMGCDPMRTYKITNPITTYNTWVKRANLIHLDTFIIRDEVPNLFTDGHSEMKRIIQNHWKDSHDERLASGQLFPLYQMEQQFVDFVLIKEL